MTQFNPPEIWKQYAVLYATHAGRSNTKISQWSDVNLRMDSYSYWRKPNIPVMVLEVILKDCNVIYLPTRPHIQHGGLHQVPGGNITDLYRESGCWKTRRLAIGCCVMLHKQKNLVLAAKKNSVTSPIISGHPTLQITIPSINMCGSWLSEKLAKFRATTKMNWG